MKNRSTGENDCLSAMAFHMGKLRVSWHLKISTTKYSVPIHLENEGSMNPN